MLTRAEFFTIFALGSVLLSAVTFIVYGLDKRRAVRNRWRVSESSLHLLSVFGGWPGALAGQQLFRHKTQKLSFRVLFYVTIAAHVAALFALYRLLVA